MDPELAQALADWFASFRPGWVYVHEHTRPIDGRRFRQPSHEANQRLADAYARAREGSP